MTLTWLDTPGSKLPTTHEPLDFETTQEVVAISVGFGQGLRAEERAYRDGAFLYPYLRSTKDGLTFSLVRDGGWPANPQLYVDESTPIPLTFWSTLYEKDLTTLANQTISATMVSDYLTATIAGLTWALQASSGSAMVVNGTGVTVRGDNTATGGNGYAGCHFGLRADLLPGFDPDKWTCVQVRATGANVQLRHVGATMYTGASQYQPSVDHIGVRFGVGNTGNRATISGVVRTNADFVLSTYALDDFTITPDVGSRVFAVAWGPRFTPQDLSLSQDRYSLLGNWTGAMPAPESMIPVAARRFAFSVDAAALAGIYVGSDSGGGIATFNLTHIRVLQK